MASDSQAQRLSRPQRLTARLHIRVTSPKTRNLLWGLFFISPWIIGFLAFMVYPILGSLYYSFTNFNVLRFEADWVGLANYREIFTQDRLFRLTLSNTFRYAAMFISIATIMDILAAFLLSLRVKGLSVYRTMLFLPVMTPAVAAAMTWVWILNPKHGLVNGALAMLGIQGPPWLASPRTALFSLVLVAVWASGRAVLIYLAGIQDIPSHLYEAAEIDGANPWHRMRHITLPLLTPVMLFNVVTMLIFSLQEFSGPFIMTGGGPNNSTLLYGVYLYRRAFMDLEMGVASAMAWVLFVVVLLLTLLIFRLSQRWVFYDR
jgi:multiple sugar transport system permease protein